MLSENLFTPCCGHVCTRIQLFLCILCAGSLPSLEWCKAHWSCRNSLLLNILRRFNLAYFIDWIRTVRCQGLKGPVFPAVFNVIGKSPRDRSWQTDGPLLCIGQSSFALPIVSWPQLNPVRDPFFTLNLVDEWRPFRDLSLFGATKSMREKREKQTFCPWAISHTLTQDKPHWWLIGNCSWTERSQKMIFLCVTVSSFRWKRFSSWEYPSWL